MYRVTGVTPGLIATGDQWLVPSYVVALADGRTITLLAVGSAIYMVALTFALRRTSQLRDILRSPRLIALLSVASVVFSLL